MKYFIHTAEGRLPVKSLKAFECRGEHIFLHVRHDNRDAIGITHRETGASAGHVPRYTGYRAVGMKRIERSKDDWLGDALYLLGRHSEERFRAAIDKARSSCGSVAP